ncbi:hypothetical protein ACEPAG_7800 [Sanghuangporus baumii]
MAAMETKKRKREAGPPRVMFTAPARTFERLLKEGSLRALKLTVGKKLGLDSKTVVELCQIRDGKTIDLEDEDDFDAFKSYAVSNGVAEVKVIVSGPVATSVPPVRVERSDARQNGRNPSMASGLASNNQAHFNSDIQTNEDSEPQGTVLEAIDEIPRSGSKHNEKRTLPSVRPMDSSSADASKYNVISVSGKKSHPQSQLASGSLDAEKSTEHTAELATVPNEVSVSGSSSATQESTETSKPGESGKDKGNRKKSGKEGGFQSNAADATPARVSDVEPSIVSPVPSPMLPIPEVEVAIPRPPKEVKKPRAKRLKTSALAETVDRGNQKQSDADLPLTSLPGEEAVHNKKSEERQPANANDKSPSPARADPKIKKRKRDIDNKAGSGGSADLETVEKSKKRKTASGAGDVMAVRHEGEISANSPACSNIASAVAKSKPSKAKKKNKPNPEEESHYDEALDIVISKVLAKRVSASSRQIPSTEPVTTTVSSAANDQIDSASADKLSVSNRKKRRKKSEVTGVSATTPSSESSENVSSKPITVLASPNDSGSTTNNGQRPIKQTGFAQGALQKRRSDRAASPPDRTVVKTVPVTRTFVQTFSVAEEQNATETAIAMQSKMPTDQPKSGATTSRVATDSIELTAAMKEAVPPTRDTGQPVAPDSLSSTSSAAHDATRERDENSSSDSGSDSDSDPDGDVPSNTEERAAGDIISSLRDPISSFAIAGLNIDDSMDIDSLLIPKSNVSWRKITMSVEDVDEDKQELMSDVEEGESDEGRNHKNAPQNSLLVRYAPSSASTEEENEDDVDVIGSENLGSAQASNSMSETGSFSGDSRPPTKTTATSRQSTGFREDNSMSPKPDVLAAEPDTDTLPDKTQSQPSPPLPSFSDVNARGESILTEHVANVAVDRAMEEDDTLFLTSIGKPNQQTHSAKLSVTGNFGITHDQLASARLMNETAGEGDSDSLGGGTSVSETSKESEERNPSPGSVSPSKATKPVSQGESKASDTTPHPLSLQSIAFSQNSTVSSSERGASGVVKRMKDRYGRNADANVSSYSNLGFTGSTPVKERRHTSLRALQLSQPIVTEESDTPHTAATQVSTQEKYTFLAGDSGKAPLQKKPAGAITAAEKPGTGAESAAHPSLQKASSQPPQTATAPTPAAIQTLHVDRSQSSQDIGNQQKSGSQASSTHVNSASTEGGSTTEVEHSEAGQRRPSRNSSPYIPLKDARPTARPRSPVPSETEEDSGSDGSDSAPLLQQVQNHAPRPSIVGLRSLHNIASRRELFSPASTPRPSFALSPATRFGSQRPAEVPDDNDSDDDDSSSSSSDSDSNNQSSIPKDKRAGNAPSHRKNRVVDII